MKLSKKILKIMLATVLAVAASCNVLHIPEKSSVVTYHVREDGGNDNNNGTSPSSAFRTIQKAADKARPGDTILVYEGVYRERVKPQRGGASESARITYMAKPGNHVVITGLDIWSPEWLKEGNLNYATPAQSMFTDSNYVDGGNPFKIAYFCGDSITLGQVVVDSMEYEEQKNKVAANAAPGRWWADQKSGAIYINFMGDPDGKKVEIVTRRGVFRPYLKGFGYITVQGFDIAYCGNNAATPGVMGELHPNYQSGMVGTSQGHHWRILGNRIRNAKGLGLSFSIGTDMEDEKWWDPHGLLNGKVQMEVDYPEIKSGYNEMVKGNSQLESKPYKEVGFNLIANNDFESCGMNAIAGIGSLGNTIYGNRFSNNSFLMDGKCAEDAVIKLHMQYGTLIEENLFENLTESRVIWIDNNLPATRISRNVFMNHKGENPVIFFEISSSLDQYLSVVDNNLFLNNSHGVVSAAADGVAFFNNLFYKGGDGLVMGSNRDQAGSDYGNMRIHNWNNLFLDQERAFGFAYNQEVNFHTSDYNLVYRPKRVAFAKYLLTERGTGEGNKKRPNVTSFSIKDISNAKKGGKYWKEKIQWEGANSSYGNEADLGFWRGTMGKDIDRHSEERPFASASNTNRSITFHLGSVPSIPGAPVKKGAEIDFYGKELEGNPKAGPFQELGVNKQTFTFWDDEKFPALPKLPAGPGNVLVKKKPAEKMMEVSWTNNSSDAKFMHIERRVNGGPWKFWGYITTTQDFMQDYEIPVDENKYEYRVAARNAAGISDFAYARD